MSFNAAALSDTLLDSQLFGHERGAFIGAQKTVKGKFELAHGGTLLIDEIADLSLAAQAKILRAVEYGEFERLGGEKLLVADVRLVSATHLPLVRYMNSDRFRMDLFHRICGIRLTLPPLRERPGDLRALIATYVVLASRQQGKSIVRLSGQAVDALLAYHWPGNLRELKRVIHVAMTPEGVVPPEAIMLDGAGATGLAAPAAVPLPEARDGDLGLRTAEERHIRAVLDKMGGNKRRAAKALGLSRSTLDRKLSS